jgi:hypothetical protein
VGVGEPAHVPVVALSVWPAMGEPEICGRAVFWGGVEEAATAGALAMAWPATLVAVTCTAIVKPLSLGATVYVEAVAPEIAVQLAPFESQSSH